MRVDLHVQQPVSTITKEYIQTHEAAFRFELLSQYILKAQALKNAASGADQTQTGQTEKYDEKMAMKAISQTVEPLLNAYRMCREHKANADALKEEENKASASTSLSSSSSSSASGSLGPTGSPRWGSMNAGAMGMYGGYGSYGRWHQHQQALKEKWERQQEAAKA